MEKDGPIIRLLIIVAIIILKKSLHIHSLVLFACAKKRNESAFSSAFIVHRRRGVSDAYSVSKNKNAFVY